MTQQQLFGTDGIRGAFGSQLMRPEFMLRLAEAVTTVLQSIFPEVQSTLDLARLQAGASVVDAALPSGLPQAVAQQTAASASSTPASAEKLAPVLFHQPAAPLVVIARDPRSSGAVLAHALASGFAAQGLQVALLGVMPTPLLAQLTRELGALVGVMVSASHNPYQDNGLKFFDPYGGKINTTMQQQIEQRLASNPSQTLHYPADRICGTIFAMPPGLDAHYRQLCQQIFEPNTSSRVSHPLQGLKIVVDAAQGACYQVLPTILRDLGAQVQAFACEPDGCNINQDCGTLHAQTLRSLMLSHNADVGIAVDGDGDRLLMADADGRLYHGDLLLYILATWPRAGQTVAGVVGTEMTNHALEQAFARQGIAFQRAKVGDRYVLQELARNGWQLGGENSGHLIDLGIMTTGDATMAALSVLRAMLSSGKSLAQLTAQVHLCQQKLTNFACAQRFNLQHPVLLQAEQQAQTLLADKGRILLRFSGTEPLLRLMVEAEDEALLLEAHAVMSKAITACIASEDNNAHHTDT